MSETDPVLPGIDEDDSWWREAERRARRDVAASRRKARLRRALRWLPHVGLTALVITAVTVAATKADLSDFRELQWPTSDTQTRGPVRLLPEALEGDPYTGTPAEKYASGDAAIVVPKAATALGPYSAEDVRRALVTARQLLILSRLDPRVLVDGNVEPYLARLAPNVRAKVRADASHSHASRLAHGEHLLAEPRATGTMTAKIGRGGLLTVVSQFVFVYPLRPELPVGERSQTHVIVRSNTTFEFVDGKRYAVADHGVWPASVADYWYNISCDAADRGFLALPKLRDRSTGAGIDTPGTDERQYRPDAALPARNDCTAGGTPSPSPR